MSDIHRHSPELFDFTPAREEPLEVAGPDQDGLEDFEACGLGICCKHDGHEGPCDY